MGAPIRKAIRAQPSSPGEARAAARQSLAIASVAVSLGYGVPIAAGYYGRTAGARLAMSYYRAPILTLAANHARSGTVRWAARSTLGVSRGARYAGYAAAIMNPFMTYKYLRRGDYTRAAISFYGPPGTVWVYNRALGIFEKDTRQPYAARSMPSSKPRDSKMKKKMSKEQRNRLWRMGLRWCPRHKRYDKCSLRAR